MGKCGLIINVDGLMVIAAVEKHQVLRCFELGINGGSSRASLSKVGMFNLTEL